MTDQATEQTPRIEVRAPKRRTDLATVFGLLAAIGLIIAALMAGGEIGAYVNGPSFLIVIGGTIAVTTASFSGSEIRNGFKIIGQSIFKEEHDPRLIARQLLEIADLARRKGLLSLQSVENDLKKDPFLHRAVQLVSDGHTSEYIDRILGGEVDALLQRHSRGANILRRGAEIAPAMGLIGTLVGLVRMLSQLEDPSTIGPSMAVALLTTFYGAILGTVILSPMATKLERNSQTEATNKTLILTGVTSIARQENPRRLEMLLNAQLSPVNKIKFFE